MKALAYGIAMLTYAALGLVQWFAEVDGLHEVLGWPSFLCWLVAGFTAFVPFVGTAAGIWGAHAAWGWAWLPALALFLGVPLFFLLVGGSVIAAGGLAVRLQRKALVPTTSRETSLLDAQQLANKYGAVLERSRTLTRSEGLLPASRDQIKGALITLARQARRSGASPEALQSLRTGYGYLADFVSERDAEPSTSFDNLIASAGANTDEASLREHAAKIVALGAGPLDVKRRTTEEFARLIAEFDERIQG